MGLISLFTTSFIVGLSGALMPGPLTVLTIRESHKRGFYAGPLVAVGHGLLEMLVVIALGFGLSSFISKDLVMVIIGSIGGVVLMIMGVNMVKEAQSNVSSWKNNPSNKDPQHSPILSGILYSISNPYWSLWWITIGASYLLLSLKKGIIGTSLFYLGHILADFLWLSLVALAISQGKKVISERYFQVLITLCGIFLIGLAFWFVYSSFTTFIGL